jgi:RNA polymerase sigma-70 factor, ECF subfamily
MGFLLVRWVRAYNVRHLEGLAMTASERNKEPELPLALLHERQGSFAPSLYRELHKLAVRKMRFERANHTLQPTALVNEAYVRLAEASSGSVWQDRAHFLAVAAHVMRHILVDHARSHDAEKRGAGAIQVTLDDALLASTGSAADVLAVDEALTRLAKLDARQAEILELHFFAGMTFEEIAAILGISTRTAKRDSNMARAWMKTELSKWQP